MHFLHRLYTVLSLRIFNLNNTNIYDLGAHNADRIGASEYHLTTHGFIPAPPWRELRRGSKVSGDFFEAFRLLT